MLVGARGAASGISAATGPAASVADMGLMFMEIPSTRTTER